MIEAITTTPAAIIPIITPVDIELDDFVFYNQYILDHHNKVLNYL